MLVFYDSLVEETIYTLVNSWFFFSSSQSFEIKWNMIPNYFSLNLRVKRKLIIAMLFVNLFYTLSYEGY